MDTVAEAGRRIVTALDSTEAETYAVVSELFHASDLTRRRLVDRVASGPARRDESLGFGAVEAVETAATIVVVLLNGVACNVGVDALRALLRKAKGRLSWRSRRQLRRALDPGRAGAGPAARLSGLSPDQVAAVGELANELGAYCGLPPEKARQLGNVMVAVLTDQP